MNLKAITERSLITLQGDEVVLFLLEPTNVSVLSREGLRARVNAQLRRGGSAPATVVTLGPFTFAFDRMEFRRDGVPIELSRTEQKLLRILVENRGHAVSRTALVERVWSDGAEFVEENALSVTVKRLRAKLEADPARPDYIRTVYGIGYTWAVVP